MEASLAAVVMVVVLKNNKIMMDFSPRPFFPSPPYLTNRAKNILYDSVIFYHYLFLLDSLI